MAKNRDQIKSNQTAPSNSLVAAANGRAERRLNNGADVDLDGLVRAGETGGEVGQLLAVVGDVLAEQLEGDDARLAVLVGADEAEDAELIHVGADVDDVVAGAQEEVLDVESAYSLVSDEVGKGDVALGKRELVSRHELRTVSRAMGEKTYNIEGEVRSVGNLAPSVEVPALVVLLERDLAVQDLGAREQVERLDVERLLEVDVVLPAQAGGLDLGLALDGQLQRLVVDEPDVVVDEGVHVGDGDLLGDVDHLVLVGGRLREVNGGEGGVRLEVLEVEVAAEGIDVGVDRAVGLDGGVDLHGVGVGGGVQDVDALDLQLGVVHLGLCDLGHTHEDAAKTVSGHARRQ